MSDLCRPKRPTRTERSRHRAEERRRRLAAALRENLQRRKAQVRARRAEADGEAEVDDNAVPPSEPPLE